MNTDQMLAGLAASIPGLTGVWFDGETRELVFAVDAQSPTSLTSAALVEISTFTERAGWPPFPISVVVRDRSLLLDLLDWRLRARTLAVEFGMTSLDVDERNGELVIGVDASGREGPLRNGLAELGIPLAPVRVRVESPAQTQVDLTDRRRPTIENGFIVSGLINVLYQFVCTHGADVVDAGPRYGFITASHCSADEAIGTFLGSNIHQNLVGSGNQVGVEWIDPAPFTGPSCGPAPMECRYSDAMFVAYTGSGGGIGFYAGQLIAETDTIGTTTPGGTTVARYRSAPQSANVLVGFPVRKTGQKTGTTAGLVINTCLDMLTDVGVWLLCQDRFSGVSDDGDSGSPVYFPTTLDSSDPVLHVGVLWGGNTDSTWVNFSPWYGITSDLGIFY